MKALLKKLFAPKVVDLSKYQVHELLKINISSANPTDIEKQVRQDILNLCVNRWYEVERKYICCIIVTNLEDAVLLKKGITRFIDQGVSCLKGESYTTPTEWVSANNKVK